MSTVSSTSPAPAVGAARARAVRAGPPADEPWYARRLMGLPVSSWLIIVAVAAMLGLLYRFNLERLWLKTAPIIGEANWSHSVCVPLIGLYYLYMRRSEVLAAGVKPVLPAFGVTGLQAFLTAIVGGGTALVAGAVTVLLIERLGQAPPVDPALAGTAAWLGAAVAVVAGSVLHARAYPKSTVFAWGFIVGGAGLMLGAGQIPGGVSGYLEALGTALAVLGALATVVAWGPATLIGGLLLSAYGIWPGQNDFVWDTGMVLTIFGVVLTLAGWGVMKIAWFPIGFLLCALPWPGLVYSKVALPLQFIAAEVAVVTLRLTGVKAGVNGSQIFMSPGPGLPDRVLNVAEACAGMRSLMTFITVGAAVAFLSGRPLWQKLVITASAVPIAIICNVARVSGQGLLDFYVSSEWSQGFAHQFAGLVMLIPAFFMILGVAWVLDNLFVEEADETTPRGRRQPAARRVAARPATKPAPAAGSPATSTAGAES